MSLIQAMGCLMELPFIGSDGFENKNGPARGSCCLGMYIGCYTVRCIKLSWMGVP